MHSVNIIRDERGNAIVVINDIRFKDRQNIDWHAVEEYLYEYVGENVEILETDDIVYIGDDFPKEVKGSEDTRRLKGTNAKAKANATTETIGLLQYASNKRWQEILRRSMGQMLNMDGIDLPLDLHCQYIQQRECLKDITYTE